MTPSELLTIQAMKYYDKQYMKNLERLLGATYTPGKSGSCHIKKSIEKRLAAIYPFIK